MKAILISEQLQFKRGILPKKSMRLGEDSIGLLIMTNVHAHETTERERPSITSKFQPDIEVIDVFIETCIESIFANVELSDKAKKELYNSFLNGYDFAVYIEKPEDDMEYPRIILDFGWELFTECDNFGNLEWLFIRPPK